MRVQSVTWAAMVDCPCDWWWLVASSFPRRRESIWHGATDPVIADLIRNPEVRRTGKQQVQPNHHFPSPLMGEESKARVNKTKQPPRTIIPAYAGIHRAGRQQDKTNQPSPSYWLQGSIHRAGHDNKTTPSRHCGLDPQSRGEADGQTTSPTQPTESPLP